MTTDADAMVILANSIDLLSAAIEHVAEKMSQATPGAPQTPAQPLPPGSPTGPPAGPPGGNGGPPKGEKTVQEKRGGLIFLTARDHNSSVPAVAQSVFGDRAVDADARKWSDADQQRVLDAMKEWTWLK